MRSQTVRYRRRASSPAKDEQPYGAPVLGTPTLWHGFVSQTTSPLWAPPLRHPRPSKMPRSRGALRQPTTFCRSTRLRDDAARGDDDPAAVLLADRMNTAETRDIVARRDFLRADLGALDERRIAIDIAHRPAGQRPARTHLLRRHSRH